MLPPFANLIVERIRGTAAAPDTHGNIVLDWTSPDVLPIYRCWMDNQGSREIVNGRQTTILTQWWYGPEDADVLSTDRLKNTQTGIVYEVDSDVVFVPDPVGPYSHKMATLKAVTE